MKRVGSRLQVFSGLAKQTTGGSDKTKTRKKQTRENSIKKKARPKIKPGRLSNQSW